MAIHYDGGKHSLAFTADKSIILHGVYLFGSEDNSYTVTLEVKNASSNTTIVSKSGTYSSQPLLHNGLFRSNYYGFQVSFDYGAYIKRNTTYHIEALISGPPSGHGTNGLETIIRSGVPFRFYNLDGSSTTIYLASSPNLFFLLRFESVYYY